MQSFGREALNSSWNSSSKARLEFPWQEARLRGKFYDEYREKREAKLREEHAAKKAEKEIAKLKAMQELEELEKRKAEITGKSVAKSPEKRKLSSQSQPPPLKLQSPSKTRLSKNITEQNKINEDDVATTNDLHKGSSHQKGKFNRGASGELLRPGSPTQEVLDPSKSTSAKKNPSKNMPSPNSRTSKPVKSPLRSPSPKSAKPRVSSTSNHSTMKRWNQSLIGEKSLTQSLSNLAVAKKNPKTVSGQPGPNSTIEKLGLPSSVLNKCNRNKSGNEACQGLNLNHCKEEEKNPNCKEEKKTPSCKEEKKNPNQPRKAPIGESDSNSLSGTNSAESPLTSKPSSNSKVSNKISAIPLDSKPFLRKGSGIGTGSGRIASRVKSFSHGHSSKPSEDEAPAYERITKERVEGSRISEPYEVIEGVTEQKKPDQIESGESYEPERNMQIMPGLNSESAVSEDCVRQHEISNSDKNIPSASEVTNSGVYTPKMAESSPIGHGKEIKSSSKIVMSEESMGSFSAAASLFDSPSLIHSHHISSGLHSELVKSSSLKLHKHYFSEGVGSEADAEQNNRKCENPQKPILVSVHPKKDVPKGLKRFLNFGRRNKSKTVLPHSASASNLSEGDESMNSLKKPSRGNANDILQRGQVQAKDIILRSPSFIKSYDFQSMNSSVKSSPTDILREEDLTGATVRKGKLLLQVPRSLFALPSFRSKGSNSKSRCT